MTARILLDACVLYPTVVRELLLGAAAEGLYRPLWSDRILEEWARAAAKLGPGQEAVARGEIAQARVAFPAASVAVPDALERRLWLPDPNDIHVLAAAVAGHADGIITFNAADFPRGVLAEQDLTRNDPDNFLLGLAESHPAAMARVVAAVTDKATRLSDQPWTARNLLRKARMHRMARAFSARPEN